MPIHLIAMSRQVFAEQNAIRGGIDQTNLPRHAGRRGGVIAGDHDHLDAGVAALPDRLDHAVPNRVLAGQQAGERPAPVRFSAHPGSIQRPMKAAQHLVTLRRETLDLLDPVPPRRWLQSREFEQDFRRALADRDELVMLSQHRRFPPPLFGIRVGGEERFGAGARGLAGQPGQDGLIHGIAAIPSRGETGPKQ